MKIEDLAARLSKHQQRATYAAVGGVVGRPARSAMHGLAKTPQNSWVVAKETGKPSGYSADQMDPRLPGNGRPISSSEGLANWLRNHT
jgi:hypothetical protein